MRKRNKDPKKKEFKIESTYVETVTFNCPVRGLVTQEITIKRYAYRGTPDNKLDVIDIGWDNLDDIDYNV